MKHMLFAPLLISGLYISANAFPWNDIVLQIGPEEKYIVKQNAVEVSEFPTTIGSAKYFLSGKYYRRQADSFINRRKLKSLTFHHEDENIEHFENEAELLENNYAKFKHTLKKYDDDTVLSQEISYTPIFQDFNGNKIAVLEKKIICPNPKLKEVAAAYHQQLNDFHLNILDRKVCDKYAKF